MGVAPDKFKGHLQEQQAGFHTLHPQTPHVSADDGFIPDENDIVSVT